MLGLQRKFGRVLRTGNCVIGTKESDVILGGFADAHLSVEGQLYIPRY